MLHAECQYVASGVAEAVEIIAGIAGIG